MKIKKDYRRDSSTLIFAALFTIYLFTLYGIIYYNQDMETLDEWIKIIWYIHTMKYSAMRKKDSLPLTETWIDLDGIILNEISQTKTNTV